MDSQAILAHASEHAGLLITVCLTCHGVIRVDLAAGMGGLSHGLHPGACKDAYAAWMRGERKELSSAA